MVALLLLNLLPQSTVIAVLHLHLQILLTFHLSAFTLLKYGWTIPATLSATMIQSPSPFAILLQYHLSRTWKILKQEMVIGTPRVKIIPGNMEHRRPAR